MSEEITKYNLTAIAKKLRETADEIPNGSEMGEIRTSLRNQALHLATYQENLVDPMTAQTMEMMELTTKLDESFRFNRSSFNEGIESILLEIENAKDFIDNKSTEFVVEVSEFFLLKKMNRSNPNRHVVL